MKDLPYFAVFGRGSTWYIFVKMEVQSSRDERGERVMECNGKPPEQKANLTGILIYLVYIQVPW